VIVFDQVQKSYQVKGQAVPALQPTSMTIETGEIFGIVGHSGAGKSTLVRLINLLEPPTGGRILIDDENITGYSSAELRAFRRKVGMIFQHFNLLSSKTVADNIAFPMKLAGIYSAKEIRDRVDELLQRVNLSDGNQVSLPAVRRSETAGRHCPRPGLPTHHSAVRRGHQRPGPANHPVGAAPAGRHQ